MIFLLLSILSSSLIFVVFKWLGKLNLNTLLIIVFNYFFAGLIGLIITGREFFSLLAQAEWLPYAMALGSFFVGIFYIMALSTNRIGAAPAVIANKMSVVIPVLVAFVFLGDEINLIKVAAILLALIGIIFSTRKKGSTGLVNKNSWYLILLFLGSGIIDASIKLIQHFYLQERETILFTSTLFFMAFLTGCVVLFFRAGEHIKSFRPVKLFMGMLLGTVNFGSVYFLVLALKTPGAQSSVLFPLNNIGVVALSTVFSVFLFREHLSRINLIGMLLSVLALVLLMMVK